MRVIFMGSDERSVPSLRRLVGSVDVALVVTRTPRRAGRGSSLRRTDVALAADEIGLALVEVDRIGDARGVSRLRDERPDAIAVVAYGEILNREVLSIAPCVNLHFSLLPRWRGAAPVERALLAGDPITGVTTMLVDEGLDTGPILMTSEVPIDGGDDAGSLGEKLAEAGADLMALSIEQLKVLRPRRQTGRSTYAAKLTAADRTIDWSRSAKEEERRVRAFSPEPGAVTRFRGKLLKVFSATAVESPTASDEPGRVVTVERDAFDVACGRGLLRIHALATEGRSRLDAAEWLRGARLSAGELLM